MSIKDNLLRIKTELPSEVTLVAVSKFHPYESIIEAYDAGQRVFGESRPQELRDKAAILPKDIEWHFIGHLQSNKIKYIVPNTSLIHSCDSEKLLLDIDKWCSQNGYRTEVLLEMHIATEETKHGFTESDIMEMLDRLTSSPLKCVKIRGLMGMASFTDDNNMIKREFASLVRTFENIKNNKYPFLDNFDIKSFGMSSDWKVALEMGASHIRIGTAIFGERIY